MSRVVRRAEIWSGLFAVLFGVGCNTHHDGTSLLIRVDFNEGLGLTQLQFSGAAGQGTGFGPIRKPDAVGLPLSSAQSVLIRLPDTYAGQTMVLEVDGLVQGSIVAASQLTATPERNRLTRLSISLTPATPDGGGGRDAGVNCQNCQSGCCVGLRCYPQPSFTRCGSDAGACVTCNTQSADNCVDGSCRCGTRGSCADGQECDGGVCACTPRSCATGCCTLDGGCNFNPTSASCGNAGVGCVACPPFSSTCDAGVCDVALPICSSSGVCNGCPSRCDAGCCSGNTCSTGRQFTSCGNRGDACKVCDSLTANHCDAGVCACGSFPSCEFFGQRCIPVNGQYQCACDPTLCLGGCCSSDGWCLDGTSDDYCGVGSCVRCIPPYRCIRQTCQPP